MSMGRVSVLFLFSLLVAISYPQTILSIRAQDLRGQSNNASATEPASHLRPILVELFTAEGCSSCPRADALLQGMDEAQPVKGAQLIVLSEHVDYWDHDGWKDPNSSAALTDRQKEYVRALGLKTPYTPQIIIDGTVELRAGTPEGVGQTFDNAAAAEKIPVSVTPVVVVGGNPAVVRTRIEADGRNARHEADVYAAIALNRVESQVLRGENGGRHLTHVAVVQQLAKIGRLKKGEYFSQDVELKLKPGTDPNNLRLVAFVQEVGPSGVLGAALRKPGS